MDNEKHSFFIIYSVSVLMVLALIGEGLFTALSPDNKQNGEPTEIVSKLESQKSAVVKEKLEKAGLQLHEAMYWKKPGTQL